MQSVDGKIFIFENAVPNSLSDELARRAAYIAETHGHIRKGAASRGGHSEYTVLDGISVERFFPEIVTWYYSSRFLAQNIWRENVVLSPYNRSAINIKVYHDDNCTHGWHTDTNPISALLYLTNNPGSTQFRFSESDKTEIETVRGRMVLFKGRDVVHGVPKAANGRIVVTANLYLADDIYRPSWIDELEYENAPPPKLS